MNPEGKRAELIYLLVTAAYGSMRYSSDHPLVRSLSEKAVELMQELLSRGGIDMAMTEKGLLWNNAPVSGRASSVLHFSNAMSRKGVVKISFKQNITADDLRSFAASLFEKIPLYKSKCITVEKMEKELLQPGQAPSSVINSAVKRLSAVFYGITAKGKFDTEGVERIVADLTGTLLEKKSVLRLLCPFTDADDYISVHSVNVTLLSLFQAHSLNVSEESLKEVGISSLLHNVGKLFYRSHSVGRLRNLSGEDWEMISRHPSDGALYLSKIHDIPVIAPVVAFEHHMKFNGTGYPDTKRIGKTQHVCSQMVAISDFFESLRMDRPYHAAVDQRIIAGLLLERSGSDFNPALVKSFLSTLGKDIGII